MDALGRINAGTDAPLVDERTLRVLLRDLAGDRLAAEAMRVLHELPSVAFRPDAAYGAIPRELAWFELARRVVIFDPEPDATFADLALAPNSAPQDAVLAVNRRFPGLEPDLLDPAGLPTRLHDAVRDGELTALYTAAARQLGWWAALVGALLTGAAAHEHVSSSPDSAVYWPLVMHLMASGVGDWTLTVVASCLLAPAQ
jgi:hypothetical protein